MHEIEAKLRVESHSPVRERLETLGATALGCVREHNWIYDTADGSLRRGGCGLRVRETTDDHGVVAATLTFKGAAIASEYKRREELEIAVSDATLAGQLLERLGYVVVLDYVKRRESWSYGGCRIELDEPPHIGLFVEIEGADETAIRRVQDALGLGACAHVKASYVRMLVEYNHRLQTGATQDSDAIPAAG